MNTRLNALFYTILGIFAATAVVTLLALIGFLHIDAANLKLLVTAFLIELAAAVLAIFKMAPFFKSSSSTVASLAKSMEAVDAVEPEMRAVASGQPQAAPSNYGVVIRREGDNLVAFQRMQTIRGEDIDKLPEEQKDVIRTYEASMDRFRSAWKTLYAQRASAATDHDRDQIDAKLRELVRAMKKDLEGVLDFITTQGMYLDDHYRGVRGLVEQLATR
jgi:hypothetical protein